MVGELFIFLKTTRKLAVISVIKINVLRTEL